MNRTRMFALVAGLALSMSVVALAEPPQADPMRGPEVRDRQVPGVSGTFGEPGGEKKRFVNENKLPPRVFRDAMETVLNPEAPDDLRVTDEQRTRYRGWMDDFQKSVQAYMKEHAGELAELRKGAGGGGEKGRRPNAPKGGQGPENPPPMDDGAKPADGKDAGAARERLQALMAGAPKIEDLYTKIWSELSPAQQKAVDGKLDEFRARQAKEREDRYVEQRSKKKGQPGQDGPKPPQGDQPNPPRRPGAKPQDAAPGRPGADAPRPDAGPRSGPMDPQRRDRLMRLFARMTPEQQDQLLQRLEQRMRDEDGDGNAPPAPKARRQRGGPQGPGEPRPAPQPDDSMMPPPGPQQDRP